MLNRRGTKYAAIAVGVLTSIGLGVTWHLAWQEVYYLCGNFSRGVEATSVIRQLNTATLSTYRSYVANGDSRIVFSSNFNLNVYECSIHIGPDKKVQAAEFVSSFK